MKSLKILLIGLSILLLNSCSLGFLIGKNQKIAIEKDSLTTMQINKKDPEINNGKYILPRNGEPQQVVLKREGYKTRYQVITPYKLDPAGYATIGLNALIIGVPFSLFAAAIEAPTVLPFFLVSSTIGGYYGYFTTLINNKFWQYDSRISLNDSLIKIPLRDSVTKEIRLNKVAVDISPENSEDYYPTYKDYKSGKLKNKVNIKAENGIKVNDTYYSDELNNILKKNGYIDTTGLVLKSNYNQNAYLDAKVLGYKYIWIQNAGRPTDTRKTGFINVELKIKWDVLDYYKKTIYSDTIKSKSGEFVSFISSANSDYEKDALKDAMETGLYTLLNSTKFKSVMKMEKVSIIDTLKTLEIKTAKNYVSSIEQAVQSSVTIKTKDGHGSGFFVSDDGYVITNYHVISDSAKLEVIANDGTKYPAKIVRFNKEADVALIKIEKNNIIPFGLESLETVGIGKEIYVIGTPSAQDLSQTLTKGIISSVRKQANGTKVIQTDASMSPGNSGGPLINKEGKLLGIVNAKVVGMGVEGISFAIPVSEIAKSLAIKFK
ncbi:MAG: S1C family serine protease [Paludibacter sp.]